MTLNLHKWFVVCRKRRDLIITHRGRLVPCEGCFCLVPFPQLKTRATVVGVFDDHLLPTSISYRCYSPTPQQCDRFVTAHDRLQKVLQVQQYFYFLFILRHRDVLVFTSLSLSLL